MEYFTLLTAIGAQKIATATAVNSTVELTHIALGDGNGAIVMPDAFKTALVNEVYRSNLNDLRVDEDNSNWVVAEGYLPADEGNFWVREVGVFDTDGDLIAIGNYPETFKPVTADGVAKDLYMKVIFEVSSSDAVTLQVDPSVVMASQEYVNNEMDKKAEKNHNHDDKASVIYVDAKRTGFKNHLINGDMQVSQRADIDTTAVANNGATYLIDRWRGASATTQTIQRISSNQPNHAVGGKSLKFVATASTNASIGVAQNIEKYKKFKGKEITYSAWVKSNNPNARLMIVTGADYYVSNSHSGDGTWQLLQVTATLNTNITNLICYIRIMNPQGNSEISLTANVDYIEFTEAQFELGNKATSFEYRDISLEMTLCYRYFYSDPVQKYAFRYNSNRSFTYYDFPVQMRIIPSCNAGSGGASIQSYYSSKNTVGVYLTVSEGAYVYDFTADAEIY